MKYVSSPADVFVQQEAFSPFPSPEVMYDRLYEWRGI
jgi:hypothetical protein